MFTAIIDYSQQKLTMDMLPFPGFISVYILHLTQETSLCQTWMGYCFGPSCVMVIIYESLFIGKVWKERFNCKVYLIFFYYYVLYLKWCLRSVFWLLTCVYYPETTGKKHAQYVRYHRKVFSRTLWYYLVLRTSQILIGKVSFGANYTARVWAGRTK